MTATSIRKLSFQRCTPNGGQFVCAFTVTFDWDDPGGTGGRINWHLAGSVVSATTGCTSPVGFTVAESTSVPVESPGTHSASINGTLTVSNDPAGPAARNPSSAAATLDGTSSTTGAVNFYGGSNC
jgi:hypothetical protein